MPAQRTRDTQSRSLEVTTDAPQLPTLSIISPTPRAFTFPISHNLSDSPFSSPSSSPFEPDLRSLALQSSSSSTPPPPSTFVPPTTHLIRTLSPVSSLRSASPASPHTHKRRKSSCSSDASERRPKKGDEDYIKRPENAFILFRRKCCEDRQAAQEDAATDVSSTAAAIKKQRQADLSKTISQQWKGLSAEERLYWEQLAKEKKKEHEQMYPNYVYRPQRAKDKTGALVKGGRKHKASVGSLGENDSDQSSGSGSVSFMLPVPPLQGRHHGRSASAPTPPPYQNIQIPNVYHLTPSCPTSPSLLPMISRRSSHPGHPEEAMSNFDYVPDNTYMPQSFGQAGSFQASLQPSDYLRNMFSQSNAFMSRPDLTLPNDIMSSPGSSSPNSAPYTPTSAVTPMSALTPTSVISHQRSLSDGQQPSMSDREHQMQQQFDLQMEMQMQQEYAQYSWETNGALWSAGTEMLLGDDFDIGAIPPIELGLPKYGEGGAKFCGEMKFADEFADEMNVPKYGDELKYGEDLPLNEGIDFGHEFSQALNDEPRNLDGLLAFDQMMAGHGF